MNVCVELFNNIIGGILGVWCKRAKKNKFLNPLFRERSFFPLGTQIKDRSSQSYSLNIYFASRSYFNANLITPYPRFIFPHVLQETLFIIKYTRTYIRHIKDLLRMTLSHRNRFLLIVYGLLSRWTMISLGTRCRFTGNNFRRDDNASFSRLGFGSARQRRWRIGAGGTKRSRRRRATDIFETKVVQRAGLAFAESGSSWKDSHAARRATRPYYTRVKRTYMCEKIYIYICIYNSRGPI